MKIPNRLAANGEELIVYRFRGRPVGLASAFDLRLEQELMNIRCRGVWSRFMELFLPDLREVPAILVPPGARLLIRDISSDRQLQWRIHGETQTAVFTMLADEMNTFLDAVGFGNGTVVPLSGLAEGQRVRVLSVSAQEDQQPVPEFGFSIRFR
jgi:hypothetical protein